MSDESEWDFSVAWHIEDLSLCDLKNGEKLERPVFTVDAIDNKKCYLTIYPGVYYRESERYVSCVSNRSKINSSDEQDVDYKLQIKTARQNILKTGGFTEESIRRRWDGVNGLFIKTDEVLSELKKCSTEKKEEEIRTRISTSKSSFEWDVSLDCLRNGKEKKYFYIETLIYQVSIAINQDEVRVSVHIMEKNATLRHMIYGKIALLDVKDNIAFSKEEKHFFDDANMKKAWNFPSLVSKKQLLDNIAKYQRNGSIVLLCEFSLKNDISCGNLCKPVFDNFTCLDDFIKLSEDFRKLLVDKTYSDVILRLGDNVEIRAHKSVLASRSPVFSAMFHCDMVENRASIVDVVDVDAKCMEYFLQFLYTGKMNAMDYEMSFKLLMVAEKYQVSSLKEKCSIFLKSELSEENVCEILVLADMAEREFLKAAALNFAAENYLTVFPSPENSAWVRENVNLFNEVLSNVGKKYKLTPKMSPEE